MPEHLIPAPCGGCGLVCDDTRFDVAALRPRGTCERGDAWFATRMDAAATAPAARVGDSEASVDAACAAAAAALVGARAPLLHGFGRTSVEAVRIAVGLADRLGAAIDPAGPALDGASGAAVALRGATTATLGELRDRPGTIVIWREDPAVSHPRLLERLRLGEVRREDLVVVGMPGSATADAAGTVVELAPEHDLDALRLLRALVREDGNESAAPNGLAAGDALATSAPAAGALPAAADALATAGLPVAALRALAQRLLTQPHAAFVHGGGLGRGRGGMRRALALHELARELDRRTHAVTLLLRDEANANGAEDVLAWQTGFPTAVDLGAGHPRSLPGPGSTAQRLADGAVDVVLCVASDLAALLGDQAEALLDGVTVIALDAVPTATTERADVAIATAAVGVGRVGTVHRLDGIPIPLRAVQETARPGEAELLETIAAHVERRLEREGR